MKQLTYFAIHFVIALGVCLALGFEAARNGQPYTPWLIVLQIMLVCVFVSLVELEKWFKGDLERIFSQQPTASSFVENALDLPPHDYFELAELTKLLAWVALPTLLCMSLKASFSWSAPVFFVACAGVFTTYQLGFVAYEVRHTWRRLKHVNGKVVP